MIRKSVALIILIISLLGVNSCFAHLKELDIYNEWYTEDCEFVSEKPFFVIRDYESLYDFWKKAKLEDEAPYLDFNTYMVFVWAPGNTRLDYRNVTFDRLAYKDGCLLVAMDFGEKKEYMPRLKKPIKVAIFPAMNKGDIFVFKKIKKGWKEYEYKNIYTLWDMNGKRKAPFEYVYLDKETRPVYELATASEELLMPVKEEVKITTLSKEESQSVKPVSVTSSLPQKASNNQVKKEEAKKEAPKSVNKVEEKLKSSAKPSNAPISIAGTPEPKVDRDEKPAAAPGMGEDPLFGAEFDITF